MSWAGYLGLIVFFTLVFTVFYSVAYSVFLDIQDDYRRYHKKVELPGSAPTERKKEGQLHVRWWIGISILTSWMVVHCVILP